MPVRPQAARSVREGLVVGVVGAEFERDGAAALQSHIAIHRGEGQCANACASDTWCQSAGHDNTVAPGGRDGSGAAEGGGGGEGALRVREAREEAGCRQHKRHQQTSEGLGLSADGNEGRGRVVFHYLTSVSVTGAGDADWMEDFNVG